MHNLFDLPLRRIEANGIRLAARIGGEGPPLLLLHGHPQTHAIWHKVWPGLARRHTCVAVDLRGYGDSDKPAASPGHAAHAKRAMAQDMADLMRGLGHARFAVLAHDRGARVAHRLALDHADRVTRMMLLDIAPTLDMYEGTTRAFAQAYFHWFWLIQPAPL
ncbi:MAG TPA: alpha/beta fold hydrolase, partial [Bordetella sp.]